MGMRKNTSGYSEKRRAGLVPFRYDTNSQRFHQGAWKNLNPSEYKRNQRALIRSGHDIYED